METKQLILVTKELNELFGLTPSIDTKLPGKELQEMVAVQAAPLLNSKGEDELTEDAAEVLRELIPQYMDQYDKETLRIFGVYNLLPATKKGTKEPEEKKEPEEAKDEKKELAEEVEMADRLADLKDIAKEYDEFKGIRGTLSKYKTVEELREMMLDFLSRVEGKTEDSRNEKVEKVAEGKAILKITEIKICKPFNSLFDIDDNMLNTIKEHMEKNGYDPAFPIVLWNDIVIDGNTRLKAAELAGIEDIPVEQKVFEDAQDALEYAIHNQRNRRNLTQVELLRCIEVLDKRRDKGGERWDKDKSIDILKSKNQEPSHYQTAKTLGIGKSKVSDARTVLDDKKARHQVETGKKSISAAAKEVRGKKKLQKQIDDPVSIEEITRIESVAQVLKDHSDSKMNISDIAKEANDLYKNSGGQSDLKESKHNTDIVIEVLIAMDWIEKLSSEEIQISEL